jgi:hypothetical protein
MVKKINLPTSPLKEPYSDRVGAQQTDKLSSSVWEGSNVSILMKETVQGDRGNEE